MQNSKNLRGRAGFTLLELMVSFAIVGFVLVIVASALRLGINTVDKGERRINFIERFRTSMNIINSQIQSQLPLTFEEDGERKYYFQGDRESIQFSTNYSIWDGQKGYVLVKYEVESDGDGKQTLSASENVIGMDNIRETMLFNDLDTVYFEYFYKGPTDEEGSWVEEWVDNLNLPEKVKVHLVRDGTDLSMIIPIRTAGTLSQMAGSRGDGIRRIPKERRDVF